MNNKEYIEFYEEVMENTKKIVTEQDGIKSMTIFVLLDIGEELRCVTSYHGMYNLQSWHDISKTVNELCQNNAIDIIESASDGETDGVTYQ